MLFSFLFRIPKEYERKIGRKGKGVNAETISFAF
jgi:hypothetical protein